MAEQQQEASLGTTRRGFLGAAAASAGVLMEQKGAQAQEAAQEVEKKIPFRRIERGDTHQNNQFGYFFINREDQWREFWDKMGLYGREGKRPAPAVDFTQKQILAILDRPKATGGFSLDVWDIVETKNGPKVILKREGLENDAFGPQIITTPFDIVELPISLKTYEPMSFEVRREIPISIPDPIPESPPITIQEEQQEVEQTS